jgi:hypothetical protein
MHSKHLFNSLAISKKENRNFCNTWSLKLIIEENIGGVSALAHQQEYVIIACSNTVRLPFSSVVVVQISTFSFFR